MADIVLKDRNGRDVQYPGVNYLKVNTVDGGTQGFAAYDPETLKAENIKNGVTVGDVEGALEVPELLQNVPVELDFSNGDMEFDAPDGYAVKSAVIQQPANLVPGNIAKDVDIAGVVGTLEAGGGSRLCTFLYMIQAIQYYYASSSSGQSNTWTFSTTQPSGSVLLTALRSGRYAQSTSATTSTSILTAYGFPKTVTATDSDSGVTFTISDSLYHYKYSASSVTYCLLFTVSGLYVRKNGEEVELYADNSATGYPSYTISTDLITTVDLSESSISVLPEGAFIQKTIKKITLPATIVDIGSTAFRSLSNFEELDMSRCTVVPTITSTTFSSMPSTGWQIKIPAALYDEWIVASNWSKYASNIVPV